MAKPIRFEQMDGSMLGGALATHITEPVKLEMGEHWELSRFVVVATMNESLILGLAWLDKWGPTIWWEGFFWKLRIATGPSPLPHERAMAGVVADLERSGCQAVDGPAFPQVYSNLAEVFREAECEVLPPPLGHRLCHRTNTRGEIT